MNQIHPAITRRNAIAGTAIAMAGCLAGARIDGQEPAMQQKPATSANQSRSSLHLEFDLAAAPQRIYDALLDSKQFAAFSGAPAEIDPNAGGVFKMFGGQIEGRNVELIADQRIVQAWRPAAWPSGVYSIVHFELKPSGSDTAVTLGHTGFPEGDYDHLLSGWNEHYVETLKKYFAGQS